MESANSSYSGFFSAQEVDYHSGGSQLSLLRFSEGMPFVLYKSVERGRIRVIKAIVEGERENPLYREMLRKEFEIGRSLNHPNIREYYSLSIHPALGMAIEMEWIDGYTLEELLEECRESAKFCDSIAAQLLDAVRFLHMKQVVHRDLKPENILVTRRSNIVKVIDFSLSDSESHVILKEGAGTALYAAPEVLTASSSNFSADIYSLGVIFSRMSERKQYRLVAERATRMNPSERFESVEQMKTKLFKSGGRVWYMIAAGLFALIVASLLMMQLAGEGQSESESAQQDFVDSQVIEDIFLQATELLEEPDSL